MWTGLSVADIIQARIESGQLKQFQLQYCLPMLDGIPIGQYLVGMFLLCNVCSTNRPLLHSVLQENNYKLFCPIVHLGNLASVLDYSDKGLWEKALHLHRHLPSYEYQENSIFHLHRNPARRRQ